MRKKTHTHTDFSFKIFVILKEGSFLYPFSIRQKFIGKTS